MTHPKIELVGAIMELGDPGEVNRRLGDGWILLSVGSGREAHRETTFCYVVGQPRWEGPRVEDLQPVEIPDGTTSADQVAMLAQWISDNMAHEIGPGGAVENAIRILVKFDELGRRVEDLLNWFEVEFPEDALGPEGLSDVKIVLQRFKAQSRDEGRGEALIPADRLRDIEEALGNEFTDDQVEALSRLGR